MTTIYLSNNRIQAVCGEGGSRVVLTQVTKARSIGSPEEVDAFQQAVEALFSENKLPRREVKLVLGTTPVITRTMRAPNRKRAAMQTYLEAEFSDVQRRNQPVYGYSILPENKKSGLCDLLAAAVDRAYLERLTALFGACGISIAEVEAALPCAVRALREPVAGKTCIVQLMEDKGFFSLLFVDGVYVYSTYSRLSSVHGTAQLGSEIARSVSSISQFAKAQRMAGQVTAVFLAGFSEEDRIFAAEAIGRMGGGLEAQILPESEQVSCQNGKFSDCVFAAGGLLTREKTGNLLQKQRKGPVSARVKVFAGLAVLTCLLAAATVFVYQRRDSRRDYLAQLQAYNSSEEVLAQSDYYDALLAALTEVNTKESAVGTAQALLSSYPLVNDRVGEALQRCASGLVTAEILEYSSETGQLKLQTAAENVENIHAFVAALEADDLFAEAEYSGYTYVEETALWSVDVVAVLASGAGREEP